MLQSGMILESATIQLLILSLRRLSTKKKQEEGCFIFFRGVFSLGLPGYDSSTTASSGHLENSSVKAHIHFDTEPALCCPVRQVKRPQSWLITNLHYAALSSFHLAVFGARPFSFGETKHTHMLVFFFFHTQYNIPPPLPLPLPHSPHTRDY